MATYLITGASRGIGQEFVRQLAAAGHTVHATVRDSAKAGEIAGVANVHALEVTDQRSIDALAGALQGTAIDVLINNAGVSSTSKTLATTDAAELSRCFAVNSIAPMMVTKAMLGNVRAGQRKLVVNITSQLASIANNTGGSTYAYRASKTALNQLTASLANELRPEAITVIAMHPGWVKTDMGGPAAPLAAADAVSHMLRSFENVSTLNSGRFLNYDGKPLPW